MQTLVDKSNTLAGYLYNNVILLPDLKVGGVILAHCVYTQSGEVKGKFFKNCLFNEDSELVAQEGASEPVPVSPEEAGRISREAWVILSRTKNHVCPWVTSGENWCNTTLDEFLSQ